MSKPPGGLPTASALPAETNTAKREIDIARVATELRCRKATLQELVQSGSVFLTRAFQCRQQACSETHNGNPLENWWSGGQARTISAGRGARRTERTVGHAHLDFRNAVRCTSSRRGL